MGKTSPEYQREWRAKNREHTRAYMRAYMREYLLTHPQKNKERFDRTNADPDALAIYRRSERERKRNQTGSVAYARKILAVATGVERLQIPVEIAEAKAGQLRTSRLIRELSGKRTGRKRLP